LSNLQNIPDAATGGNATTSAGQVLKIGAYMQFFYGFAMPNPGKVGSSFQNLYKAQCFVAGTPLLTPTGSKLIDEFVRGDVLLSRDENAVDGVVEPKVVEEVFSSFGKIVQLHVGGRVIGTTVAHPFWVQGKGWRPARELFSGDRLFGHDGQTAVVDKVVDVDQWATVYNLKVADFHTYFVGCQEWGFSVWAHNASWVELTAANATATEKALVDTGKKWYKVETPTGTKYFNESQIDKANALVKELNAAPANPAVGEVAPAKVVDPHLDANILIALSDPKNVNHAAALKFVTDNQAAGLSASVQAIREMLAKPGIAPDAFKQLQKAYGIKAIPYLPKQLNDTAARLQAAFTDGRVLRDADARVAANAYLRGEKLGTADLQFYKRAKDLGLDVEFVGSDPGALAKAANYVPNTVTIPPP
jgi:predicted nucleic acid-binding protein